MINVCMLQPMICYTIIRCYKIKNVPCNCILMYTIEVQFDKNFHKWVKLAPILKIIKEKKIKF